MFPNPRLEKPASPSVGRMYPGCCTGPERARSSCVPYETGDGADAETHVETHVAPDFDASGPVPEGWSERDWRILLELARGDDALVGFQGLKRRLELHPEALRRSLSRLVESGEVAKTASGYRLTDAGHDRVAGASVPRVRGPPFTVAAFLVPSRIPADAVVDRFTGRWFDGLYWYGVEPADAETVLTWLTPDDDAVRLRLGMGVASVEVAGRADPDVRVVAASPLVAAVAAWLRQDAGGAGVAS
jgi:hypothetical protein